MSRATNPSIHGASDLYQQMLEVKNGMPAGGTRGFTYISKKQCRELGIEWGFVENSAQILGLVVERHARFGYSIGRQH